MVVKQHSSALHSALAHALCTLPSYCDYYTRTLHVGLFAGKAEVDGAAVILVATAPCYRVALSPIRCERCDLFFHMQAAATVRRWMMAMLPPAETEALTRTCTRQLPWTPQKIKIAASLKAFCLVSSTTAF